jgi:gliding motility-associated-like protein
MKTRITYLYLLFLLLPFAAANAQSLPAVCKGSIDRYSVSGLRGSTFEWIVTGGTKIADYSDSVDIRWDGNPGIQSLTVIEHTEHGCIGEPITSSVLVGSASLDLGPDQISCQGSGILLEGPSGYSTYYWSDGSSSSSFTGTESGSVWLEVTDAAGCKARDTVLLTFETPFQISLGPDTTLCGNESIILEIPFGQVNWTIRSDGQVNHDDAQSITVYAANQEIYVAVTQGSCSDSDTMLVWECNQGKIPNAITPNGDGKNDTWIIEKIMNFPDAAIKIFDRTGRIVFEVQGGYDNSWDGTDKNGKQLPVDTYYYVIDLGNGKDGLTGFITIIR